MDISSVFGNRIKALREKENKTQAEAAKEIGTNAQTLGRYEKGDRKPDIEMVQMIADYYNVSVDFLLGREPKFDNQELFVKMCELTGLSEEVISTIVTMKQPHIAWVETLNALLENEEFISLITLISEKFSIEEKEMAVSHAGLHTVATNVDIIDYNISNRIKKITDDIKSTISKEKTQSGKLHDWWKNGMNPNKKGT